MDRPVVLEAYAGKGKLYDHLYRDFSHGAALEKNEQKAAYLARQRPSWKVYECDSVAATKAGLLADQPFSFIDIDPYGSSWDFIDAYFCTHQAWPERAVLAVNDGLRRNIKLGTAWKIKVLAEAVRTFGSDLYDIYLSVCRWMLEKKAAEVGLTLSGFEGFYAGHAKQMTHYYAVLTPRSVHGTT